MTRREGLTKAQIVLQVIRGHADAELALRDAARRTGEGKDALVHSYAAEVLLAAHRESRAALASLKGGQ